METDNKGKRPEAILSPGEILENWIYDQEDVRLFALCGERAIAPDLPKDEAVYEYYIGVEEPEAFAENDWGKILGEEPMVDAVYLWNPISIRLLFEDRTRFDLYIDDPQLIAELVMADENPDIIFDKDDLTCSMTLPTNFSRRESAPSVAELELYTGAFFRLMTDTAFNIHQRRLLAAEEKLSKARALLFKMVEVAMERKLDYSVGLRGNPDRLDRYLNDEWYNHLAESYVECTPDRLWDGLFQACILFRKAGLLMDEASSFDYPRRMDVNLMNLFRQMWEEDQ